MVLVRFFFGGETQIREEASLRPSHAYMPA